MVLTSQTVLIHVRNLLVPMKPKFTTAAIAVLGLLTSACTVVPQRGEVGPVLPAQFDSPESAPAPALWWSIFGDAQLDALIREALKNNPGIHGVEAQLRAALASADAAGAGLIPEVAFELSHRSGSQEAGVAQRDESAGLSAAYEVDLWGRVRASRNAAVFNAQASEQELFSAQVSLSANVAILWFQTGTAAQQLVLIEQERERYARILKLMEVRFRNGLAAASDVLRQRQLLESTRALEAQAQADLGVLQHALEELLGKVAGSGAYLGAAPGEVVVSGPNGVPATVVNRRPDVQQTWLQVRSADEAVAGAIASRFPQINLSFSYASQNGRSAALFQDWIDTFVASLALPLIDGGSRRAEVTRTQAVLDQRIAEYRSSVLTAFREIQDAQLRLEKSHLRISSLEEQLRISSAVLERVERQLRQGGADYLAVLDAQIADSSLRRDVLSARQLQLEQQIALLRATAGPLPMTSSREKKA